MHNCQSNYKYDNSVIVRSVSDSSVDRTLICDSGDREFDDGREFFGVLNMCHTRLVLPFSTQVLVSN